MKVVSHINCSDMECSNSECSGFACDFYKNGEVIFSEFGIDNYDDGTYSPFVKYTLKRNRAPSFSRYRNFL